MNWLSPISWQLKKSIKYLLSTLYRKLKQITTKLEMKHDDDGMKHDSKTPFKLQRLTKK